MAMNVFGTVITTSPGCDAGGHQGEAHRVGSAGDADAVAGVAETARNPRSNSSTIGPPINPAVRRLGTPKQFRFEFLVRSNQIQKWEFLA